MSSGVGCTSYIDMLDLYVTSCKERSIRKLIGWGTGVRRTMKIFAQGKINKKKNSCTPINPKKVSCSVLKKLHKGNVNEKISCG